MFCGVGGFDLALIRNGHEIIGSCEIDKYARETYRKNFGHYPTELDATRIEPKKLPNFDLLCAGFPCQSFSVVGTRRGFEDTRGTLFFEIARIAKEKRPEILLLENVKGLLNHDNGRTFETIIKTLDELGYWYEWQVLNSKDFGVPQNRERIFIVAHLRGKSRQPVFPIGAGCEVDVCTLSETQGQGNTVQTPLSGTLVSTYWKGWAGSRTMIKMVQYTDEDTYRIYSPDGIARTIRANSGGMGSKTGVYQINEKLRMLTPLECERIQGFPDNWTNGVSKTQRYRQMGNAVTVNVVEAIIRRFTN